MRRIVLRHWRLTSRFGIVKQWFTDVDGVEHGAAGEVFPRCDGRNDLLYDIRLPLYPRDTLKSSIMFCSSVEAVMFLRRRPPPARDANQSPAVGRVRS